MVFTETGNRGYGGGAEGDAMTLDEAGGRKIEDWALVPKDALSRLTRERLVRIIDGYKKERTGQ